MNYLLPGGLLFLHMLLIASPSYATKEYSIVEIRNLYGRGVEDEQAARKLLDLVNDNELNDPLILGYRGGAEALMAKHAWNPYTKLEYLDKSMKTLQRAIDLEPGNTEVRFIRFSIQFFIPRFLGLSKNLKEDAHVIALNFNQLAAQLDPDMLLNVGTFMIDSGYCSANDTVILRRYMK